MSAPLAFYIMDKDIPAVIILCFAAYLSDIGDGYIARKFNEVSEAGKIIDPIADKLFVGTAAATMLLTGMMPFWFGIAILSRDILIMAGGLYSARKLNFVIPSNYTGKGTVLIIGLTMIGLFVEWDFAADYAVWIALAAMIFSLFIYSKGMIEKLKDKNINA